MANKIAQVVYYDPVAHNWNKKYLIEYKEVPLTYAEATKPCGDGVWIYNSAKNILQRWSLTMHDLPFNSSSEKWNVKNEWHLVTASSHPLWVWWGESSMKNLQFDSLECALPKIKTPINHGLLM